MSAENSVYGALDLTRRDPILGYKTGYARADDGYGTNNPLPRSETSFDTQNREESDSNLSVELVRDTGFRFELQAIMYEVAAAGETEAEVLMSDVGQIVLAMEHMQDQGHLTGSTPFEVQALAEEVQKANPDETTEEIIARMQEAWDFICDLRQAYLAGEIEQYLTATTDSRPGAEQLLGSRA